MPSNISSPRYLPVLVLSLSPYLKNCRAMPGIRELWPGCRQQAPSEVRQKRYVAMGVSTLKVIGARNSYAYAPKGVSERGPNSLGQSKGDHFFMVSQSR